MLGGNLDADEDATRLDGEHVPDGTEAVEPDRDAGSPVMPSPPQLIFRRQASLSHQVPGVGFESGRDSRAR